MLDLSQGEIMELNVELLAQSFGSSAHQGEALVDRFDTHGSQKFPAGTPLFTHRPIKAQPLPLTSRISVFQDSHCPAMFMALLEKSDRPLKADHAQLAGHDVVGRHRLAARVKSVTTLPVVPMQQCWFGTAHACRQGERVRAPCNGEGIAHHQIRLSSSQAELSRTIIHQGGPYGRSNA